MDKSHEVFSLSLFHVINGNLIIWIINQLVLCRIGGIWMILLSLK